MSATITSLATVAKAFVGAVIAFVAALLAVTTTGGALHANAYLAATLAALTSFSGVWLTPNKQAVTADAVIQRVADKISYRSVGAALIKPPVPAVQLPEHSDSPANPHNA